MERESSEFPVKLLVLILIAAVSIVAIPLLLCLWMVGGYKERP